MRSSFRARVLAAVAFTAVTFSAACVAPPPPKAPPRPAVRAPASTTTTVASPANLAPIVSQVHVTSSGSQAPATFTVHVDVADPNGDRLAVVWWLPSGEVRGAGPHTFTLDEPGEWLISVSVSDAPSRGAAARTVNRSTVVGVDGWDPAVLRAREARIASGIVERHNVERVARGLDPLEGDDALAGSAHAWSSARAADPSLIHDTTWMGDSAVTGLAENVYGQSDWSGDHIDGVGYGHGIAASAHVTWMGSTSHRDAILDPRFERVGVGVLCDAATGRMWVTVRFAGGPLEGWPEPAAAEPVWGAPPHLPGDGVTCTRG